MNDIEKAMKGDSEAFNRLILEYKSKFYKTAILDFSIGMIEAKNLGILEWRH